MKIRIKAGDIEIEYEQLVEATAWPFMLGKKDEYSEKFMHRVQQLINGVDQLLKAKERVLDERD